MDAKWYVAMTDLSESGKPGLLLHCMRAHIHEILLNAPYGTVLLEHIKSKTVNRLKLITAKLQTKISPP